jgi:hypothetical protein
MRMSISQPTPWLLRHCCKCPDTNNKRKWTPKVKRSWWEKISFTFYLTYSSVIILFWIKLLCCITGKFPYLTHGLHFEILSQADSHWHQKETAPKTRIWQNVLYFLTYSSDMFYQLIQISISPLMTWSWRSCLKFPGTNNKRKQPPKGECEKQIPSHIHNINCTLICLIRQWHCCA